MGNLPVMAQTFHHRRLTLLLASRLLGGCTTGRFCGWNLTEIGSHLLFAPCLLVIRPGCE
jgi:hypothetical protein